MLIPIPKAKPNSKPTGSPKPLTLTNSVTPEHSRKRQELGIVEPLDSPQMHKPTIHTQSENCDLLHMVNCISHASSIQAAVFSIHATHHVGIIYCTIHYPSHSIIISNAFPPYINAPPFPSPRGGGGGPLPSHFLA